MRFLDEEDGLTYRGELRDGVLFLHRMGKLERRVEVGEEFHLTLLEPTLEEKAAVDAAGYWVDVLEKKP